MTEREVFALGLLQGLDIAARQPEPVLLLHRLPCKDLAIICQISLTMQLREVVAAAKVSFLFMTAILLQGMSEDVSINKFFDDPMLLELAKQDAEMQPIY